MLSKIKPQLEPLRLIIAKPFVGIHPNILSLFGVLFSILFFFALLQHAYIVACLALVGTAFDMVDGTVARLRGKESPFGEVLDSVLDRVSDSIIIIAFGFAGLVHWGIVALLLMFSLLTSYARHRGEEAIILHNKEFKHYKLDGGTIERPERIIIIFLTVLIQQFFPIHVLCTLTIPDIVFLFLAVLSCITVIQRVIRTFVLLQKPY
jgi:CDP-diacylglycerol--glycerol-3-phosphate 3-phosphatidyltransferase